MLRRLLSILFVVCMFASSIRAQTSYAAEQQQVLAAAANQWLINQLREVNPRYFDCNAPTIIKPAAGEVRLFGQSITLTQEQVNRYADWCFPGGDCQRFLSVVAASNVYLPLFKKKAQQLQLHEDAAWMPVVLSGCNQQFRGSGDRVGLWAMPYLAARKQHLRIDSLLDERMGADFTTDAALKHYRYLLETHSGDDLRAAAAYRWGSARVASIDSTLIGEALIAAMDSSVTDYLGFYAYTLQLMRSAVVDNQLTVCMEILGHWQPVVIDKQLRVEALTTVLKLDESAVRSANPVYTGKYLAPGYRRVPFVLEDTVLNRYRLMADSIARWQPPAPVMEEVWETTWINHRVGKGENLGRIASKHHVSIAQLKKWNKLRSDKIRQGQLLKIEQRRKVTIEKITEESFPEEPNLDESPTEVISSDSLRPSPFAPSPSPLTYTVKRGDTLWSIARKFPGVTEQDLMKWNKCGQNIRPGQKLRVTNDN
ncbi:MAG: LysM peptidoglycan-binding domain-containing protein [Flavobacteriales bacterium]